MERKSGLTYNISRQLTKFRLRLRDSIRTVFPQYGYRESDVIIASFPKSGRNWVRFLLANSIVLEAGRDEEIHFHNSSRWVSTSEPRKPPVDIDGYPRMVADHGEYQGQETRVIYILRHPADVMESYYVYLRDRWNEPVGEFSSFIRDEEWGVPAWRSHVESWEGTVDILVTFEDLKADPGAVLAEMYTLFERDLDDPVIDEAVRRSSFKYMSRMEEKYGLPEKQGANDQFTFMRKGESTQGEEFFDESDYQYLREAAGDVLERYDYEVPTDV